VIGTFTVIQTTLESAVTGSRVGHKSGALVEIRCTLTKKGMAHTSIFWGNSGAKYLQQQAITKSGDVLIGHRGRKKAARVDA
jgi:hypothetical protein